MGSQPEKQEQHSETHEIMTPGDGFPSNITLRRYYLHTSLSPHMISKAERGYPLITGPKCQTKNLCKNKHLYKNHSTVIQFEPLLRGYQISALELLHDVSDISVNLSPSHHHYQMV